MFSIKGLYSEANVMIGHVEESCIAQITHFLNHPAFTNPVVIMPDTHAGAGAVVGFTMEMTNKIIPNVIGVDIGCGMQSINIGKNLSLSFENLDLLIRNKIPFGQNVHDDSVLDMKKDFPWHRVNVLAEKFAMAYSNKFGESLDIPRYDIDWFIAKCKDIGIDVRRAINSLASLGGGNHFIEVGISRNNDYWITLHSGSRNFGLKICTYWQNRAKKFLGKDKKEAFRNVVNEIKIKYKYEPRKIKEEIRKLREEMNLDIGIDMKGCEWLENEDASGYLFDMIFSQVYAEINREYMIRIIEKILKSERTDHIHSTHNFIDFDDFIIRKGAIRSYENERIIIPFNMRDGILICEGKSNPLWNYSAPHGAGRVMSRSQAKKNLSVEDFKIQMSEVFSTSVGYSTLDEAPGAYKDAKIIEEAIEPTAKIIDRIKPLHNMKDS